MRRSIRYTQRLLEASKKLGMAAPPARPVVNATQRSCCKCVM